ncbi:MAG TPA: adenylate/guanylate cyclase domain-containing protein [Verrucomicrobiae bacterium]|nr:adenylate/guanylate cyclase domain-containing protein [Verrucomicrobiae bacterium]
MLHRPKWIVVIFGILIFWLTHTGWLVQSHLWQKADGALIDRRYLLRAENLPDPDIKLIGLGTTSFQLDSLAPEEIAASPTLQKMQQPWPWDRSVYAAILQKLMDAGAKVVMFDFVFASETEGDDVFAKTLQKYKDRVVIGEMVADDEGPTGKTKKLTLPNQRLLLPDTDSVLGLVNIWTEADDTVRRIRYQTSVERERLEIPATAEKSDLDPRIITMLNKEIREGKIPDNLAHVSVRVAEKFRGKIVTPPSGTKTYINFQNPPNSYRAWPVENMFVDSLWQKPPFKGGLSVSNKIVIVGPMAEIFHDSHATPFGETPGPEVHAQILAALLQNEWLTGTSERINFWLATSAVILALLICFGIPQALLKGLLLIATTVAFLVGCQAAFTYNDIVVSMMPPLVCLIGTGSFGIIFEYSMEQLERRRYRHIFNRYVSKNVAKVILEDTRSVEDSLRGIKKPVTILFSDIRGFTTMTEKTDADKLVAQLNEYFGEMVDIIQETNSGTLQKFIGDAIMAAWGDTHTLGSAEDARRAVSAALAMRAGLTKLNAMWKDNPDRQQLATGIGVNHGEVVYGNIGSKNRTELTVLGDGVNLAARLESSTKQFHTDILIGEETEKLTREHFIFRKVGAIAFKGKTKPVETYALISDKNVPPPAWLKTYHDAVALYRDQKFKEAVALFDVVQKQIGVQDYLCEMYAQRCSVLSESPPSEHWDSSFTLAEK